MAHTDQLPSADLIFTLWGRAIDLGDVAPFLTGAPLDETPAPAPAPLSPAPALAPLSPAPAPASLRPAPPASAPSTFLSRPPPSAILLWPAPPAPMLTSANDIWDADVRTLLRPAPPAPMLTSVSDIWDVDVRTLLAELPPAGEMQPQHPLRPEEGPGRRLPVVQVLAPHLSPESFQGICAYVRATPRYADPIWHSFAAVTARLIAARPDRRAAGIEAVCENMARLLLGLISPRVLENNHPLPVRLIEQCVALGIAFNELAAARLILGKLIARVREHPRWGKNGGQALLGAWSQRLVIAAELPLRARSMRDQAQVAMEMGIEILGSDAVALQRECTEAALRLRKFMQRAFHALDIGASSVPLVLQFCGVRDANTLAGTAAVGDVGWLALQITCDNVTGAKMSRVAAAMRLMRAEIETLRVRERTRLRITQRHTDFVRECARILNE